ncbi:MAG: hypothetical protein AB8C95_07465 [Phycisphaeraceae bacterium]
MPVPTNDNLSSDAICDEIEAWAGPRRVYPISFCIPESLIVDAVPKKEQATGQGISRGRRKYKFGPGDQQAYYADYQQSYFGLTYRKGGWDCMRHLEIMANGCLPFFPGIDECPRFTMAHYPKVLIEKIYRHYASAISIKGFELSFDTEALQDWQDDYDAYVREAIDHTKQHLTTRVMADYVLDKSGHAQAKSVLFISNGQKPDYLSDLLFIGLRQRLGAGCMDVKKVWWTYDTADAQRVGQLYGNGFTYTRHLPEIDIDRTNIKQRIAKHEFDAVVFGSVTRCHDLLPLVRKHYEREEVILIEGEDSNRLIGWAKNQNVPKRRPDTAMKLKPQDIIRQGILFKRELDQAALMSYGVG